MTTPTLRRQDGNSSTTTAVGFGLASATVVAFARLLECWRRKPHAASHQILMLGQRLGYPVANPSATYEEILRRGVVGCSCEVLSNPRRPLGRPEMLHRHRRAATTALGIAIPSEHERPGETCRVRQRVSEAPATIVPVLVRLKPLMFLWLKLKFVATAGTALLSVGAYGLSFGWPFATGFVGLLFVHEMGRAIQLRREGVKDRAPMFVPLRGAVISVKSIGRNALAEARVGVAGPILGTVGAGIMALSAVLSHVHRSTSVDAAQQRRDGGPEQQATTICPSTGCTSAWSTSAYWCGRSPVCKPPSRPSPPEL